LRKSATYKEHSTAGEIAFIIELILRPNRVTDNILKLIKSQCWNI